MRMNCDKDFLLLSEDKEWPWKSLIVGHCCKMLLWNIFFSIKKINYVRFLDMLGCMTWMIVILNSLPG